MAKENNIRSLIGIDKLFKNGIVTLNDEYLFFIKVKPINTSIIGKDEVIEKVSKLTSIISSLDKFEILTIDANEDTNEIIENMKKLLKKEKNEKIRNIIMDDINFIKDSGDKVSQTRDFFVMLRFKNKSLDDMTSSVLKVEKLFKDNYMQERLATKDEIKKLVSRYINCSKLVLDIDDLDGMKWGIYYER